MILVEKLSGKVCSHSNTYFAERNGTQYTGTICNPYTGEPTEKQLAVRNKFAETIEALNALTEEQKEAYIEAFRKQKKCKTLRGFIFSQLYNNNL
jgi:hypothetical protein